MYKSEILLMTGFVVQVHICLCVTVAVISVLQGVIALPS